MRSLVTILGLLSAFSTWAYADSNTQSSQSNSIVCTENNADQTEDDGSTVLDIGKYTVDLDNQGRVLQIHIERKEANDLPAVDLVWTNQNAKIVHNVRPNDKQMAETWGIQTIEAVEAKTKSGGHFLIRINDHSYAGPVGSTVLFAINGKKLNTENTGMVDCKGPLRFPHANPLDGLDLQGK